MGGWDLNVRLTVKIHLRPSTRIHSTIHLFVSTRRLVQSCAGKGAVFVILVLKLVGVYFRLLSRSSKSSGRRQTGMRGDEGWAANGDGEDRTSSRVSLK